MSYGHTLKSVLDCLRASDEDVAKRYSLTRLIQSFLPITVPQDRSPSRGSDAHIAPWIHSEEGQPLVGEHMVVEVTLGELIVRRRLRSSWRLVRRPSGS